MPITEKELSQGTGARFASFVEGVETTQTFDLPPVGGGEITTIGTADDGTEEITECEEALNACLAENVACQEEKIELEEEIEEICSLAPPTGTWTRSLEYCFSLAFPIRDCDQQNVSMTLKPSGLTSIDTVEDRYAVYLGSTSAGVPKWYPGRSMQAGWVISLRVQWGGTIVTSIDTTIDRTYDVWYKDTSGTPDVDVIIDSFTILGGVIIFSESPCDE